MFYKNSIKVLFSLFILVGCSWNRPTKPSVLVIAVENLAFESFSCSSEQILSKDFSGFRNLCEEAVRFTHAFTPSTMSQATLASIMTGLYPHEHHVTHNGGEYLSGSFQTVAEVASQKGYRTSFFSGGAPVFRKSGLAQGFELFEDNTPVSRNQLYRPMAESSRMFLRWLRKIEPEESFFSTIFVSDLQFPGVTTMDSVGEIRNRSYASQLREIGETLGQLIDELRRRGRWDSTHVIILGTNASAINGRPGEEKAYSLYSSTTQVKLFIKPARKRRDKGIEWKIDKNVTLVDVGATLFDFLQAPPPEPKDRDLIVTSLTGVLERPEVNWKEDRLILIESGWPAWHEVGGYRYALRKDQYLLIFDERPKLFNTLIDRLEIAAVDLDDPLVEARVNEMMNFFRQQKLPTWRALPETLSEKLAVARSLWRDQPIKEETTRRLNRLSSHRSWDEQIWGWRAYLALQERDWKALNSIGDKAQNKLWKFVANKNLNRKTSLKGGGCLSFFIPMDDQPTPHDCDDSVLISLHRWIEEQESAQKIYLKEEFLRKFRLQQIDRHLGELNYVNGLSWSVSVRNPAGPSFSQLLLSLPENRTYEKQTYARLSEENF